MNGVHGERHQSDADAAAAVCEQHTREMCVRARYRTICGCRDIVRSMNPRLMSRYHVIDMITKFIAIIASKGVSIIILIYYCISLCFVKTSDSSFDFHC